jgi:hypothetical protein
VFLVDPKKGLAGLQKVLGLAAPPRVIEGVDIAHLAGNETVASLVQFIDGLPFKPGYKRYRIKSVDGIDDFKSIHEVVSRRFARLAREGASLPDVFLVDGGKGQLSAALDALESLGAQTRLMTAIRMDGVAEPYIRRRARRHLEKGRIVILAAGTGSPYVTTDTAAAQRALELGADILMKATRVDGVYSDDPEKNPHALLYNDLTYQQVREQNLRVMDATAISQCMEHRMPILVFNYRREGNIERAVAGERLGTLIT